MPDTPPSPVLDHVTCSTITITWDVYENMTYNYSTSGYTVRYKPVHGTLNDQLWSFIHIEDVDLVDQNQTTFTIEGLSPWKLYQIQLSVWNELGNSSFSESIFVATAFAG